MPGVSQYEALQVASVLQPDPRRAIQSGVGLFAMPVGDDAKALLDCAVLPAMRKNELNLFGVEIVFDDASMLMEVCRHVQSAEAIVVDLADLNPSVMYVLGLCHGMGRCPILLSRDATKLPFNLGALRCIDYVPTPAGLFALRERLARALRVFLLAARAPQPPSE